MPKTARDRQHLLVTKEELKTAIREARLSPLFYKLAAQLMAVYFVWRLASPVMAVILLGLGYAIQHLAIWLMGLMLDNARKREWHLLYSQPTAPPESLVDNAHDTV